MKNIMIWIMLLLSITYTDAQNGKSPRKDYAKLANYDESKVPQYTLPSVLMCHDGEMVQTKEQWEQKTPPRNFKPVHDLYVWQSTCIKTQTALYSQSDQ